MRFILKVIHFLGKKGKELCSVNNVTRAFHAWKRWRASYPQQEPMEGAPRAVARAPKTPSETIRAVARAPINEQVSPRLVARAPTRVEVMPREFSPNQNSTPAHVIDVQPEKVVITKESADKDKNFF